MERILAIVAEENDYASGLADYFRTRADFIFYPIAFSTMSEYVSYEQEHHVDMLLCEEQLTTLEHTISADNVCVLSELAYVHEQQKYPEIFKYQSSEKILQDIINIYGKRQKTPKGEQLLSGMGSSHLITVCSPIGGCFKSTFSLALAQYYSRGGKTLFLSLDPFFLLPREIRNSTDKNMSDVLYYLECYGREPMGLIEKISRQYGNLDYISGVSHWIDVCNIQREHTQNLLNAIKRSNYYEVIIVDIGMVGVASLDLMSASEKVYVPLGQGNNTGKLEEWRRQLSFIGLDGIQQKLCEIAIPYDELLADNFSFDQLLKGRTGKYIEELEGQHYIR